MRDWTRRKPVNPSAKTTPKSNLDLGTWIYSHNLPEIRPWLIRPLFLEIRPLLRWAESGLIGVGLPMGVGLPTMAHSRASGMCACSSLPRAITPPSLPFPFGMTSVDHCRIPAPSGQYPRRGLRTDPTLTVDPPRDPDYRAFLLDVAARLAGLQHNPFQPPHQYRLRSYQPTLCNYWHDSPYGHCWKCSQVTRAFVTPSITPPNWDGQPSVPFNLADTYSVPLDPASPQ